jgi:hypothetical protein
MQKEKTHSPQTNLEQVEREKHTCVQVPSFGRKRLDIVRETRTIPKKVSLLSMMSEQI